MEAKPAEQKQVPQNVDAKVTEKPNTSTPARSSVGNSRTISPQVKESAPSATSTVERDVLKEFKTFASQQRENAQKARSNKAKADKEIKLTELKKFANSFKLSTPVPSDLVSIIAKDPAKQKEIQAKAIKNAEELAKSKTDPPTPPATTTGKEKSINNNSVKETHPAKLTEQAAVKATTDTRAPRTSNAHPIPSQTGPPNRQQGHRQQYPQNQYQTYRSNRGGPQHVSSQQQTTGQLSQRLKILEQQKFINQGNHQHPLGPDGRAPPTGPANTGADGGNFQRRLSGVPSHVGGGNKLNPNSHEFRPGSFATLNPNGHPSATSSPRSAVNSVPEPPAPVSVGGGGQLIRRKTKAVDVGKCYILSHIKTITPPQGRKWDENGGLRPSFDTLPTWRQLQDDEKSDSTMHLTYKEHFERQPFATPNPPHVLPSMPHQHQLPFHLQQGGQHMGQRQSPLLPHMSMHNPQHGPASQPPYVHDDHRMVHSNSAQSFASPRLGSVTMAYPGVNSSGQVPYNQAIFMGPNAQQVGQFRSFSNSPQYMGPQQGQMGGPMMMQPPFMAGPQGMVGGPQMIYPGGHPPFMPSGGPPQPAPAANGYSPRPQATMMAHQGSQQGQPMYGMSPNVQYSQPAYSHGQGPSQ